MTLPRPVLIALLGVALCAAAFLATRSASDTNSGVPPATPQTQAPAVHKAVKPGHKPAAPANGARAHKAAPAAKGPSAEKSQTPAAPAPARTQDAAPATPAKPAKPAVSPQVAKTLPAIRALARGDVVVFFFTQPGAADARPARPPPRGGRGAAARRAGLG